MSIGARGERQEARGEKATVLFLKLSVVSCQLTNSNEHSGGERLGTHGWRGGADGDARAVG